MFFSFLGGDKGGEGEEERSEHVSDHRKGVQSFLIIITWINSGESWGDHSHKAATFTHRTKDEGKKTWIDAWTLPFKSGFSFPLSPLLLRSLSLPSKSRVAYFFFSYQYIGPFLTSNTKPIVVCIIINSPSPPYFHLKSKLIAQTHPLAYIISLGISQQRKFVSWFLFVKTIGAANNQHSTLNGLPKGFKSIFLCISRFCKVQVSLSIINQLTSSNKTLILLLF